MQVVCLGKERDRARSLRALSSVERPRPVFHFGTFLIHALMTESVVMIMMNVVWRCSSAFTVRPASFAYFFTFVIFIFLVYRRSYSSNSE